MDRVSTTALSTPFLIPLLIPFLYDSFEASNNVLNASKSYDIHFLGCTRLYRKSSGRSYLPEFD